MSLCQGYLVLLSHLLQQGDLCALCQEARLDSHHNQCHRLHPSSSSSNIHWSLKLAMEGQYSDVTNALRLQGCATTDYPIVSADLNHCHPVHYLPEWSPDIPTSLTVDSQFVLAALEAFSRVSSPGFLQLVLNISWMPSIVLFSRCSSVSG